jgi:protein phosphatase
LLHHDIGQRGTVLIVADGLGGHEGGEIASQMTVEVVVQSLIDMAEQDLPVNEQLIRAVDMAHEAICKYHGVQGRTRHMASTLTAIHVAPGALTIAQVGDSRAYRFSAGKLTLLTEDQTVVHMMQKKGMLTAEEAQHHPHRNIILQALGQDKSVLPELQTIPFQHNDCLLLCSDGLSSYVDHAEIEAIMASGEDEHVRCRRLVDAANAAGGADNVTVLLARLIVRTGVRPAAASQPPRRPVQRVEERPHKSIWTEQPLSPPAPSTQPLSPPAPSTQPLPPPAPSTPPQPEDSPEEKARQSAKPGALRLPWLTKDDKTVAEPASDPNKTSIWKREIRWPWGQKATDQPGLHVPERSPEDTTLPGSGTPPEARPPAQARPGQGAAAQPWDPAVLKAVEDNLATYIGPVAKILVGRAASRTKDLQELCQALATQLSTEQERDSFLQSALHQSHSRGRR